MTTSSPLLDPSVPAGLILAGMGGPDGPDAVEPFLTNLFRDPEVLSMPRPIARIVGRFIVKRRADKVRLRYQEIDPSGGSPQLGWTRRQAQALARILKDRGLLISAAPAMRYWHPFPEETVQELVSQGIKQFVVVPTYPQFSSATSGTTLTAVCRAIQEASAGARVQTIPQWHLLPGYVEALARRAEPVLRDWIENERAPKSCALLCAAHSLPVRFLKKGDPYLDQTKATSVAVNALLTRSLQDHKTWWEQLPGGSKPLLAFQSRVGPVKWIGPSLIDEVRRLSQEGCRRLLVLPLSFTCEHIETLHELDIDLAAKAREAGIEEFRRGEALNLDVGWLESLADHVATSAFDGGESIDG